MSADVLKSVVRDGPSRPASRGVSDGLILKSGAAGNSGSSRCSTAPPVPGGGRPGRPSRGSEALNGFDSITLVSQPASPGIPGATGGSKRNPVTMVRPQSFAEMQAHAKRLFGDQGPLRLYHHGTLLIKGPEDFAEVRDGDRVVVTWDNRKLNTLGFADLVSTYQREYPQKKLPGAPPDGVKQLRPPLRFDAQTSNRIDFAEPAMTSRREVWWRPGTRPVEIGDGKLNARSTYSQEYVPKDRDPSRPMPPPGPAFQVGQDVPMNEETSYQREFGKAPRTFAIPVAAPISAFKPYGDRPKPFEDDTTYKASYAPHSFEDYLRPRSPFVPSRPVLAKTRLDSDTEYKQQFVGETGKPVVIHVEPCATPRSTPTPRSTRMTAW